MSKKEIKSQSADTGPSDTLNKAAQAAWQSLQAEEAEDQTQKVKQQAKDKIVLRVLVALLLLFVVGTAYTVIKKPEVLNQAMEVVPMLKDSIEQVQQIPDKFKGAKEKFGAKSSDPTPPKYDPNRWYLHATPGNLKQIPGSDLQDPEIVRALENQGTLTPAN